MRLNFYYFFIHTILPKFLFYFYPMRQIFILFFYALCAQNFICPLIFYLKIFILFQGSKYRHRKRSRRSQHRNPNIRRRHPPKSKRHPIQIRAKTRRKHKKKLQQNPRNSPKIRKKPRRN